MSCIYFVFIDMTEYTDSGTIGNARRADPEKGKKVAEAAIERMAAFIEKAAALELAKR